jgi:hypothetical protein
MDLRFPDAVRQHGLLRCARETWLLFIRADEDTAPFGYSDRER